MAQAEAPTRNKFCGWQKQHVCFCHVTFFPVKPLKCNSKNAHSKTLLRPTLTAALPPLWPPGGARPAPNSSTAPRQRAVITAAAPQPPPTLRRHPPSPRAAPGHLPAPRALPPAERSLAAPGRRGVLPARSFRSSDFQAGPSSAAGRAGGAQSVAPGPRLPPPSSSPPAVAAAARAHLRSAAR